MSKEYPVRNAPEVKESQNMRDSSVTKGGREGLKNEDFRVMKLMNLMELNPNLILSCLNGTGRIIKHKLVGMLQFQFYLALYQKAE